MKIAALKDNDSISTLSSNYDAPSAASVDCLSTFEQWNISRRPFYQISDNLMQKTTCNICMEEVFSRFTLMGRLSGCGHDFCYRCIWKWENKTIIHGKIFHCPLCRNNVFRWMSSKWWKLHKYRRKSTFVETLYFLTQT
jgi:hypothetical protein